MTDADRVRELFVDALDRPAEERPSFVHAHESDPAIVREVLSLLGHHDQASHFLDVPVPEIPAFSPPSRHLPVFADFEVERELGRGGMGVVHLALQRSTGQRVALKVLNAGMSLTATGLARFRTEAETAARLAHPAIVPLLAVGEEGGMHYIASAYIEGSQLARELDPDLRIGVGPRPGDHAQIARFVATVAEALAHAHAHAVVHRDVKPSNILVDLEGRPYLTDFGLARDLLAAGHTRTGDVTGTAAYMSPEQALGRVHDIDHRTDVFSLGVVLFEMLHGCRPFVADSAIDLTRAIVERPPVDARTLGVHVPRELARVCAQALEKDPRDRYATMEEFAEDLRACAEGRRIRARGPSATRRLRRFVARHRVAVGTMLLALAIAAAGVAGGVSMRPSALSTVTIESEPSGAEVFERRASPDGSRLLPARRLGTTPLRTRTASGLVRFVLRDAAGNFAEIDRFVPAQPAGADEPVLSVRARIVAVDATLSEMIEIPAAATAPGHGGPDDPFGPRNTEIESFAIDQREVTVGEFRRFLEETGTSPPPLWTRLRDDRADHLPAAGVPWALARAFAEWAGKRLPTFEEWQIAARGPDARLLPWGTETPPTEEIAALACVDRAPLVLEQSWDHYLGLACPPGTAPGDRSPFGLVDVLGSVAEWTASPWRSRMENGAVQLDDGLYAIVGERWTTAADDARLDGIAAVGSTVEPGIDVGFRCARSTDPVTRSP